MDPKLNGCTVGPSWVLGSCEVNSVNGLVFKAVFSDGLGSYQGKYHVGYIRLGDGTLKGLYGLIHPGV